VERLLPSAILVAAGVLLVASANAQVNVTQHHNHGNRDGVYIDPAFTLASAPNLTRDMNFNGTITGNVYAQPLYVEGGPDNRAKVIVATESDTVYALDAINGSVIWSRTLATPISSGLPCGTIVPIGVTGTPVIDLATRSLFLDAETLPSAGVFRHMVYSLNVDTGATNAGWPVNVQTAVSGFDSSIQQQRAALALVNGTLYVPYGGRNGDCLSYKGRVVGIPINDPASVTSWATTANKSGIWGVGGIADDGTNLFVVTGNATSGTATFGQQEAIVRLQAGPVFTNNTTNYWAPTNWMALDTADADLGGCGPVLIDVPGATPSQMVLALGKDQKAYLVNRTNLGGIAAPVASLTVSSIANMPRGQAGVTYRTTLGTYFALRPSSNVLSAFKVSAANPPVISSGWSISASGLGTPFVSSSDGTNNMIVWVVGSAGDQRLHGYNADTGAVVYGGGGASELMAGARQWNTGIVARGSIYLASDNKVYAFRLPAYTPLFKTLGYSGGSFVLSFDNVPGKTFSVYGCTNLVTPLANWSLLGTATEVSAGQYQFSDPTALGSSSKFYRVTAP
jgi:outer membrane protein assembly factor BamB